MKNEEYCSYTREGAVDGMNSEKRYDRRQRSGQEFDEISSKLGQHWLDGEKKNDHHKERERVCVCVCVCV